MQIYSRIQAGNLNCVPSYFVTFNFILSESYAKQMNNSLYFSYYQFNSIETKKEVSNFVVKI